MRITRTDVMALSVIAASGLTGFAISALSFSSVERTVTTDWQSVGEMPEMSEEKVLRFEDSNGRIRVERQVVGRQIRDERRGLFEGAERLGHCGVVRPHDLEAIGVDRGRHVDGPGVSTQQPT